MSDLDPCFVVVEAPVTFRYPDGRDNGCRVGYLETDAEAVPGLEAAGFRVLLTTTDELAAQIMVAECCGTLHADMLDKKGPFVQRAYTEQRDQ